MTRATIAAILALALMGTQLPGPHLEARWNPEGSALIITASPGCLWLTGGGLPDRWVGCKPLTVLPASGVDHKDTPVGREFLELRDADGLVVVRFPIPERRWEVILPLVARN